MPSRPAGDSAAAVERREQHAQEAYGKAKAAYDEGAGRLTRIGMSRKPTKVRRSKKSFPIRALAHFGCC